MRKMILRTAAVTAVMGVGLFAGSKPAVAASSTHGVVFIHGTGDYPVSNQTTVSTSALTCTSVSGSAGTSCYAPAAYGGTNYWEAGEVTSVSGGRPFAVVGFYGGSCAPWPEAKSTQGTGGGSENVSVSDAGFMDAGANVYGNGNGDWDETSTASNCPLATGVGNADIIAGQIVQFINANPGMNELEIITHSGGSNQARYILNNYTRNANFGTVRSLAKQVITLAGTTEGTYLANEVFSGSIPGADLIAGLVGYGGEGVNLLRTTNITSYNASTSYLGPVTNPVGGVNFYSSGGVSTYACALWVPAVKVWGFTVTPAFCTLGIDTYTLGIVPSADPGLNYDTGTSCDSSVDDIALLALHDLFLSANDSSTYRNGCSDGFISCQGSQALGNTFSYSGGQDHNQSRRQCNGLDSATASKVNGVSGFEYSNSYGTNVSPVQLDACGFHDYACVTSSADDWNSGSCSSAVAWTEGCTLSQLGNGVCDWDCMALYGNDAVVTSWADAPTNTIPASWGTSDCMVTENDAGAMTANTVPFAEGYPSGDAGIAHGNLDAGSLIAFNGAVVTGNLTSYNGSSCTGTYPNQSCGGVNPASYTWFTDPNFTDIEQTTAKNDGSSNGPGYFGAGFCPQSWIGDGTCDECVLAIYGSDGMDCAPGHIAQCGGIMTSSQPYSGSSYYYYNNPIYNEGLPSSSGGKWLLWQSMPAVANDGVCEETECQQGTGGATGQTSTGGVTVVPQGASGTPCTSNSQCPGNIACNLTGSAQTSPGTSIVTQPNTCYPCSSTGLTCNSSSYGWSGGTCNPNNGNCYLTTTIGAQCSVNSDCLGGTCVNGGCTTASTDCSANGTSLCR